MCFISILFLGYIYIYVFVFLFVIVTYQTSADHLPHIYESNFVVVAFLIAIKAYALKSNQNDRTL